MVNVNNAVDVASVVEISSVCKVGFFLAPSFAMLPFTAAIEVLHSSNAVSETVLYDCQSISTDGASVFANNGIEFNVDTGIAGSDDLSLVIVCGSADLTYYQDWKVTRWLCNLAASGTEICAVDTGSYILAKANLLVERRCAPPWQFASSFKLEFPLLDVSGKIFESDSGRRTCAGGSAAVHMMLDLVREQYGARFAESVAEKLNLEEILGSDHKQRNGVCGTTHTGNKHINECIDLMESNIEEPLKLVDLSRLIGISHRQLERIFKHYLKSSPRSYYLEIRLLEGQRLIRLSSLKFLEIALSCGFSNGGHFSTAYKKQFGHSPRCERTKRKAWNEIDSNHHIARKEGTSQFIGTATSY